ncbi:MAG: VENN motif pre-toxin domain-containing protein [Halobacteriovoraceae bacterium]|nr:VENN motif pre-toxin domain-containing protein [Halobacteriovoraceae bacterium]
MRSTFSLFLIFSLLFQSTTLAYPNNLKTINIETAELVEIQAKDLQLDTTKVNIDVLAEGDINQAINELSKDPKLAYLSKLKNDPRINWSAVQEVYDEWDYSSQNLSAAASSDNCLGGGVGAVAGEVFAEAYRDSLLESGIEIDLKTNPFQLNEISQRIVDLAGLVGATTSALATGDASTGQMTAQNAVEHNNLALLQAFVFATLGLLMSPGIADQPAVNTAEGLYKMGHGAIEGELEEFLDGFSIVSVEGGKVLAGAAAGALLARGGELLVKIGGKVYQIGKAGAKLAVKKVSDSAGKYVLRKPIREVGEEVAEGGRKAITKFDDRITAKISGILRDTMKGKGNFGLGRSNYKEAVEAGKSWVGKGYSVKGDGTILVSKDKLRQFRLPSFKKNLNKTQANFEWRNKTSGKFQGNGHLDIID